MITPLALTFLMQVLAAALQMVVPVLAPVLTAEANVPPQSIGGFMALTAVGTLWYLTLNKQLMPAAGPLRLLQLGGVLAGGALLLVLTGWWPAMLLAAVMIGFGYAPNAPAGSHILARSTPPRMRSLVFSIKQAGVPLGAAIAGLAAPWLALRFGWETAVVVFALGALAAVAAVQPWRDRFDAERPRAHRIRVLALFSPSILREPVRAMRLSPALLPLTYAGASFAVVQGSVFSFLVTYLVNDAGLSLATAGLAFASLQVVGVGGRVAMGWIADRVGSARRTLIVLTVTSATLALLFAAIGPDWPLPAILAVCGTAGLAVASWNGVYLGEVARVAPPDAVGDATAGSTFFTFLGYVFGPALFGGLVGLTGGYDIPFATVAALVLVAGVVLWRAPADRPATADAD